MTPAPSFASAKSFIAKCVPLPHSSCHPRWVIALLITLLRFVQDDLETRGTGVDDKTWDNPRQTLLVFLLHQIMLLYCSLPFHWLLRPQPNASSRLLQSFIRRLWRRSLPPQISRIYRPTFSSVMLEYFYLGCHNVLVSMYGYSSSPRDFVNHFFLFLYDTFPVRLSSRACGQ